MNETYGRDLDLNLLRVFAVVAETGSVTQAAARLYLTQPAVSAALRRLTVSVGGALFARQGRGIALTARGQRLLESVRTHLPPLVDAALAPEQFDPARSDRTFRLGVADSSESWLLPGLLRILEDEAPRMRLVALPVQFRTVADSLTSRAIDAAITVADEMPGSVRRETLFHSTFVGLVDPRHAKVSRRISERDYFAREHVIVSYNGDLRGVVEDALHKTRRIRCSVSSFANIGAIVEGTSLVATIPAIVAREIRRSRPHLRTVELPFRLSGSPLEMLWLDAIDDDPAWSFLRSHVRAIARGRGSAKS